MIGQFMKTVSGRESYEIYEADGQMVYEVVQILREEFGFQSALPIFGPDEVYVDCTRDDARLTVGWDNWSGCFVMGFNDRADPIVREIGDYLNTLLQDIEL